MVSNEVVGRIAEMARVLAYEARCAGLVLTIEQVPERPLAMGRIRDQVTVRQSLASWRADQVATGQRPLSVKDYVLQMAPPMKKDEV